MNEDLRPLCHNLLNACGIFKKTLLVSIERYLRVDIHIFIHSMSNF